MQSASNIELNINVQEVLPAVHGVDYLKVNLQIEEIHTIIYYGDLHCVKSLMKICLFHGNWIQWYPLQICSIHEIPNSGLGNNSLPAFLNLTFGII